MLSQKHLEVLGIIYDKLNGADINWVITGSTAFAIQGIPLEPNDIDIQTDEKGAYEIEKYFNEYVVKKVCFSSNEKVASHFGALEIDGLKVEIMGDLRKKVNDIWEEPVDLDRYKKYAVVNEMKVPVLDLEYEYQAYLKMGRKEKAELIKKYISI